MREQLVKLVDIIPIEFVVRNIATGSLTKRLGIPEGFRQATEREQKAYETLFLGMSKKL